MDEKEKSKFHSKFKNPTDLLKHDHKKVKDLFHEFDRSDNPHRQKEVFETVAEELKIHTKIEEELFYPAARRTIDEDALMNEAREEHHIVEVLISEIEKLNPSNEEDQEILCAKFLVLAENVKHHIEEEEKEIFPKFNKAKNVDKAFLAEKMEERQNELKLTVHGQWPWPAQDWNGGNHENS